jgi:hypothetical protein
MNYEVDDRKNLMSFLSCRMKFNLILTLSVSAYEILVKLYPRNVKQVLRHGSYLPLLLQFQRQIISHIILHLISALERNHFSVSLVIFVYSHEIRLKLNVQKFFYCILY